MIDDRMVRARSALLRDKRTAFYGALLLTLDIERKDDVQTMATNGKKIFYSLPFLDTLSHEETKGVLVHEIMHCANRHHTRRNGRDPKEWNVACDLAINPEIEASGLQLPSMRLFDPQYRGLNAEEIYRLRQEKREANEQKKNQNASDNSQANRGGNKESQDAASGQKDSGDDLDPGQCGSVLDATDESDAAAVAAQDAEWSQRVRMAVNIAKKAGDLPGTVKQIINELDRTERNWRDTIREFVEPDFSRDTTWSRPNRRTLGYGMYLPGTTKDNVNTIGWIVDTSGSMPMSSMRKCRAELQAALDQGAVNKLIVVYVDTHVQHVDTFESGEEITFGRYGSGGTILAPGFAYLTKEHSDISGCVCFTDMENDSWGPTPPYPVLFACWGNSRHATPPSFGDRITIK